MSSIQAWWNSMKQKNALPGDSPCMRQRKIWGDVEGKPLRISEQ